MYLISQTTGFITLLIFGIAMISLVYFLTRRKITNERFLVAGRKVSWPRGAFSIAVSWIWAPAIFIVSLQAYTQGIAGAFWFIVPNILCFFIFAPLAIRLRQLMPEGYTLPEFILKRYNNDKKTHLAFLVIFFGYQLGAIIINCLAGGTLLHILTGMNFSLAVLSLSLIALIYSLISGLEASILTDIIQMLMILIVAFILVPWVVIKAGGISVITNGFGGVTGEFGNIFNLWIAYSFGIATTLGLISGPIGDQMFFQRGFAVKYRHIVKTFVVGGLLFGLVPITLSALGFVAASPQFASLINVSDPQMVGPLVIGYFLPKSALILFVFMAFAGLSSTLDSAYCAISSLGTVDIYKKYINKHADDKKLLSVSRKIMLAMALLGTGIALLQPQLLWVFLIYGALASAGFFPIVLSLYWKKLNKQGAFWAITLSLLVGLPMSIYANVTGNVNLIVLSAVLSIGIGLIICLTFGFLNKENGYAFKDESKPLVEV
ncbi:MAG: hypothetical protein GF313_03145 [Caldithrix sp.]|nr:hypothetical protein [Caldithrix sp.]